MRSPEELTDRFRSRGLKVTPQRQAVFRVLHDNRSHPTAEVVHSAVTADLPTVSLRTVYQTLNDLTAMGELGLIDLGSGPVRFDPNLEPHHHLVCDACGRLVDLAIDLPAIDVPAHLAEGFEVTRTEIAFRGRCATCAPSGRATRSQPPTNPDTKEAQTRHG